MGAKEPRSAMFAEKKAHLQALEITLRPNIWRGFPFLASIVARFPPQDILLPCTCCESINSKPVNRGLTCETLTARNDSCKYWLKLRLIIVVLVALLLSAVS